MILAGLGKFIGAKVATAAIFLAVAAGGVWCWQHPDEVKAFGRVVKVTLIWIMIAAALPWSSYLYMRPLLALQSRMQSAGHAAAAGISLLAVYLLIDVVLAFWLADWHIAGALSWIVVLLGFLAAGTYNFVICESLARHVDS